MKKCCIIIPIYNSIPTENDLFSISRTISVLKDYDIFMVYPNNMNISHYKIYHGIHFISFSNRFFKSNKTYSKLLLSEAFYLPFLEYEYMLIAQTDTYILNTIYSLDFFINQDYDYWGAPWPNGPFFPPYSLKDRFKLIFIKHPERCFVGNGGFSLRKINSTYRLIRHKKIFLHLIWLFNEDLFFSFMATQKNYQYRSAPPSMATHFALETNMKEEISKGNIPFAVHAWNKYFNSEELLRFRK